MKRLVFSIFLLSVLAHGQNITAKQVETLQKKSKITYEDLAHENPGCPENSICSVQMGVKVKKWNQLKAKLSNQKNSLAGLESFRRKDGLPIQFLTTRKSVLGLDPILYKSRCSHHNPKGGETIYKALAFFKNDPKSEGVILARAELYSDKKAKPVSFMLPYEHYPVMVKNEALIVPQEYEDLYYHLGIKSDGKWRVVSLIKSEMHRSLLTLEEVDCPQKKTPGQADLFLNTFCKKIWNADEKKENIVRLSWSCP